MIWIVDGLGFKDHFEFGLERRTNGGATIEAPFQWKWFHKSWAASHRKLFLDFGDCLWRIAEMDSKGRGKAQSWTYHELLACFMEAVGRNVPIHWRITSTGSLIYRFGQGHVLIIEREGSYRIGLFRNRSKKMAWRPVACATLAKAKALCEGNMDKLMMGARWWAREGPENCHVPLGQLFKNNPREKRPDLRQRLGRGPVSANGTGRRNRFGSEAI